MIDAVDEDNVYELKCTNSLTMSHKLQLIVYAWLWNQLYPDDNKKFKLFNIYTCEILELDSSHYAIEDVVEILIDNKLKSSENIDDQEFIRICIEENSQIPIIENNYSNIVYNWLFDSDEE